jgi:hypothetical protein
MSLKVVSFFNSKSSSRSHDWTDQELAEFYRVEASLIRANIPIETDRGLTDEGDPWFLFCNANTGEIIVHFARFDGTYVVASPALRSCARGGDFRALIEAQIASHPLVIPKSGGREKLFIHPAALLIVFVTTCYFKLSQTTAAAGELHAAQPDPRVGSHSHSDSESQGVILDERATAAVLAAIVTGIAWAQSHDFDLWRIEAALPMKIGPPSQELSVSTLSAVASPFDAEQQFHAPGRSAAHEPPVADIPGYPPTASPGYRSLDGPYDHSAAGQTFTSIDDASSPAPSQAMPAASGPLFSAGSAALSKIEFMPVGGSTPSSSLPSAAPSIPAADETLADETSADETLYVAQFNSGVQAPAQVAPSLEKPSLPQRASAADFVLREFQAAWGVVPTATQYEAWVARIIADPGLENGGLSQALAGTTEFTTLYGVTGATIATAAIVTALCEGILGITPGSGAMLNVGLPVWQVLQNFAQSSLFIAGTSAPIVGFQNALLAGATPTGSIFPSSGTSATYALTTGNDANASLGHPAPFTAGDLITGIVNGAAPSQTASTFSPGDSLTLNGATISITDIRNYGQNELAGVTLTGPYKFVVTEDNSGGGNFNFIIDSGATNVESMNSTSDVYFTNLGAGANIEIGGAATQPGVYVYSSYAASMGPVSFQFDGGVSGVSFYNDGPGSAPTTETVLSTTAANGSAAHYDWVEATNASGTVSSVTINATTSLVAGLDPSDFTSAATLTVSGAAALVDLTPGGDDTFSTVSASGLTNGALHLDASTSLTAFTGGGGGDELLYNGEDLSASATAINGGGGTDNILSAQLANASNGGIFTGWQILDITRYGGTPFDASLLTNDAITGVQFSGADAAAETVLNIAPAATVMVTGTISFDKGLTITHSSATGDSLAATLNNTDATSSLTYLLLGSLTSTGDAAVSIASTGAAGSTPSAGYNGIGTLTETDGHLTTVTVTGDDYLYLGYSGGVATDSATTRAVTTFNSSLTEIDASATTGGVTIYAGNSTQDAAAAIVTYKGLTLEGGSGPGDVLYNGADSGVTTDGNGKGDAVWLGGSNARGVLGTGASDLAEVGDSAYATTLAVVGPEAPGSALGDTVTFSVGATAKIIISGGAEWDGATYVRGNPDNGVGQTTVVGAVAAGATIPGTLIDLSHVVGASPNIQNAQTSVAGASNLTAAENAAVAALGGAGVAYFTYGSNEFLVATYAPEQVVCSGDAVVELQGVHIIGLSMAAGVVHLA